MEKKISVAIDGPAGAGKSTIAKKVAAGLGCIYIDTGAMYRAMALHMIRKGIEEKDRESMKKACHEANISIRFIDGSQHVILNEEDVSGLIRTDAVSRMASVSSALPEIREKLLSLQRKMALENSVVMDGRDIGTVVLPDASVKIFLTASPHVRAERRYKEMSEKGSCLLSLEEIEKSIAERDERDCRREISPLKQAEDAVKLDSSYLTIEEVTERIMEIIHDKCQNR